MTNEPKPEAKAERKPEPEIKEVSKPDAKVEPKPEAKVEPKPKAKGEPPSDLTPQIIKRVHEFYEELGRESVRAVEDLEKAKQETRKDEAKAGPKKTMTKQQKK